jgi:hypothetical protein
MHEPLSLSLSLIRAREQSTVQGHLLNYPTILRSSTTVEAQLCTLYVARVVDESKVCSFALLPSIFRLFPFVFLLVSACVSFLLVSHRTARLDVGVAEPNLKP